VRRSRSSNDEAVRISDLPFRFCIMIYITVILEDRRDIPTENTSLSLNFAGFNNARNKTAIAGTFEGYEGDGLLIEAFYADYSSNSESY